MEKQTEKGIVELSEFDKTVSLWQLLPCGSGAGLQKLKYIVHSVLNNPRSEIPSIIIIGEVGKKTYARAFFRALGFETIKETSCLYLLSDSDLYEFFYCSSPYVGCVITDIEMMHITMQKFFIQILKDGEYSHFNSYRETKEVVPVFCPIVLAAKTIKRVPDTLKNSIDHVVQLEEFTQLQQELIVLQRLKYCRVGYKDEEVLRHIVRLGEKKLNKIIKLLTMAVTIMKAEDRDVLTVCDVRKAVKYLEP